MYKIPKKISDWKFATVYDFIENRMLELGEPSQKLAPLLEEAERVGFFDAWDIDKRAFGNAMAARGFTYKNDEVFLPNDDGPSFNPIAKGYPVFLDAVARIFKNAERPIDTIDLIQMADVKDTSLPLGQLRRVMREAGYHYIAGCGYWREPQFTTPTGKLISNRLKSDRLVALFEKFEKDGWPLVAGELHIQTKGLVTARWLTLHANKPASRVVSLGSGLYAPKDLENEKPFPVSANVIRIIRSMQPGDIITDKSNLRLFRLGMLMEKKGLAEILKSRSTSDGIRVQTMRIRLTDKGERVFKAKSIISHDAF